MAKTRKPKSAEGPKGVVGRWLGRGWRRRVLVAAAVVLPLGLLLGALKIDADIRQAMEGPTWDVPSVIYGEPVRLYVGLRWYPDQVESLLQDLGYARQAGAPTAGTYTYQADSILAFLRPLEIPGRTRPPLRVRIRFGGGGILEILDPSGNFLEAVETEAPKVTGFYGPDRQARDPVKLGEIPAILKDAVILVEDKRFYEHRGLDPRSILRALWADLRALGRVQGGSTITQQLAKNLFLTHRKTLTRKAAEALYAMRFESLYPKDRILEAYLNEVYLGADRGVQVSGMAEGARHYFGRDVRHLDLPQAALLAGLIRGPGNYNPFRKRDAALERRRVVLDLLLAEGRISPAEHARAVAAPLGLRKAQGLAAGGAAAYVDALRAQLAAYYSGSALETAGMRIYTPIDLRVQAAAQEALSAGLDRLEQRRGLAPGTLQGAVVVIEPGTGAVRALVGGREARPGDFNRALQARRQPGSLMKPFVYAAALASRRFTAISELEDSPIELPGKDGGTWSPANADGTYRGTVTLRQALEQSLNVPSVRLLQQVGYGAPLAVAKRCGIRSPLTTDYSIVLGTSEVTPIEMAAAYATFASGGVAAEPRFVSAVLSRSGEVLQEKASTPVQAVAPDVAFVLNDLLRGVPLRGTATALSWLGSRMPLSAKTGTTSGGRDAWFVGYTPRFLALVWVGPDEPKDLKLSGSSAALPVWRALAEAVSRQLRAEEPEPPEGVVRVDLDPATWLLASENCPETVGEWFLDGTQPTEVCPHATGWEGEAGDPAGGVDSGDP